MKIVFSTNKNYINLEGFVVEEYLYGFLLYDQKSNKYRKVYHCVVTDEDQTLVWSDSRPCRRFRKLKSLLTVY